nr:MAG TPA: hypothetical protein [Caudoviricetes sp.]
MYCFANSKLACGNTKYTQQQHNKGETVISTDSSERARKEIGNGKRD